MTVFEMLDIKYREWLKNMNEREWEKLKEEAEYYNKHIAEVMYMHLEITEYDIKKNGGYNGKLWKEIKEMHANKLLASNQHRQYHGKVDCYWLTKKGFKHYKDRLI